MTIYMLKRCTVQIEQGDLTLQNVDAIVNAANKYLRHGGGVAGAIVARGGISIQQESDEWVRLNGPATHDHPGVTGAGSLTCRYIIHAVGPVWGEGQEELKLKQAIAGSLMVANDLKCESIAFPAISTGIFGFPMDLAAKCFAEAIFLYANSDSLHFVQLIKIILWDIKACQIFEQAFFNLPVENK